MADNHRFFNFDNIIVAIWILVATNQETIFWTRSEIA